MSKFECVKCGGSRYETDTVRTTGGGWSRFFNVQNRRFTAVTCTKCQYTEFFKGESSALGSVIDFLGN